MKDIETASELVLSGMKGSDSRLRERMLASSAEEEELV
jgi:hypothetical protein